MAQPNLTPYISVTDR